MPDFMAVIVKPENLALPDLVSQTCASCRELFEAAGWNLEAAAPTVDRGYDDETVTFSLDPPGSLEMFISSAYADTPSLVALTIKGWKGNGVADEDIKTFFTNLKVALMIAFPSALAF